MTSFKKKLEYIQGYPSNHISFSHFTLERKREGWDAS